LGGFRGEGRFSQSTAPAEEIAVPGAPVDGDPSGGARFLLALPRFRPAKGGAANLGAHPLHPGAEPGGVRRFEERCFRRARGAARATARRPHVARPAGGLSAFIGRGFSAEGWPRGHSFPRAQPPGEKRGDTGSARCAGRRDSIARRNGARLSERRATTRKGLFGSGRPRRTGRTTSGGRFLARELTALRPSADSGSEAACLVLSRVEPGCNLAAPVRADEGSLRWRGRRARVGDSGKQPFVLASVGGRRGSGPLRLPVAQQRCADARGRGARSRSRFAASRDEKTVPHSAYPVRPWAAGEGR